MLAELACTVDFADGKGAMPCCMDSVVHSCFDKPRPEHLYLFPVWTKAGLSFGTSKKAANYMLEFCDKKWTAGLMLSTLSPQLPFYTISLCVSGMCPRRNLSFRRCCVCACLRAWTSKTSWNTAFPFLCSRLGFKVRSRGDVRSLKRKDETS